MNKNTYHLKKDKLCKLPSISLKFNSNEQHNINNLYEYNQLIVYKNNIDNLEYNKSWDKAKKLSNMFELIYLPNKKFKHDSISKYEPLSRAYFKLFEILVDFDLINRNNKLNIAALAEGPGGFIEATLNYRKRITNIKDNIQAITLYSSNKDIPGWNKSKNFLRKNSNVTISYGKDNSGDLYKLQNIKQYSQLFNNDVDFVTADGGFDFSYNFNKQEHLSYRILFCEIVTALSVQKKGGSFVCKFFDMYTDITKSLVYLLLSVYENVYITKPNTSRTANSEKYIVCKDFIGIDKNYLNKLYIVVESLDFIYENNMYVHQIFDYNDADFLQQMNTINTHFYNNQINSIKKTLKIIETNDLDIEFGYSIKQQTILAYNWCKYYKVSINYTSKYIKKYKNILSIPNLKTKKNY
jgi:23S rRNA U2552 (ribose-2'-O)-methylase RlmE/FtsJ